MDYSRPLNSSTPESPAPKVHIALLLLPAQNSSSTQTEPGKQNQKQKQPLLINPGGPGGSGVFLALLAAPALQQILGADQPILGFDPRGVGFTTPRADCWAPPGSCDDGGNAYQEAFGGGGGGGCDEGGAAAGLMRRLEWGRVNAAYGLFGEGEVGTRFLEVGQRGVNAMCRERGGEGGSVLKWAGTREVVRDVVGILDAWEGWVDEVAEGEGVVVGDEDGLRGKLVYWGLSYGTYLGATFARMFPERVGRVMLDGVVDAELYESPVWRESLVDADKVLGTFFRYCVEAGRKCDLYREGDKPEDVQKRYDAVMERLQMGSVTFTHPTRFFPVVLRQSLVKMIVFQVLYGPIPGFPFVATLLDDIHEGRYERLGGLVQDSQLLCTMAAHPILGSMMTDAQRAIMCNDKKEPVSFLALYRSHDTHTAR
jgi:pimeloyl-ACP methyl ester carboxylesterase